MISKCKLWKLLLKSLKTKKQLNKKQEKPVNRVVIYCKILRTTDESIELVEGIIGKPVHTLTKRQMDISKIVNFIWWFRNLHMGCNKSITKDEKKYLNDLVFKRWGLSIYWIMNRCKNECNHHFHLDIRCLPAKGKVVDFLNTVAYNNTFNALTRKLAVLHKNQFLMHIAQTKK